MPDNVFIDPTKDPVVAEKPKKAKKPRAPMSDERKAKLREQLAHARLVKKIKKQEELELIKKHKEEPKVVKEEPVVVVEEPKVVKEEVVVVEEPKVVKEEPVVKSEIQLMKEEIEKLKKSNSDKSELATLKKEMAELKASAKAYAKAKKDASKKIIDHKLKTNITAKPINRPLKESVDTPTVPSKPRYSTYKKSIWSGLM